MKKVFFGGLKNHWKDYILVLICGIFMVTIIFLSNSLSDCLQWIIDGQITGNAEESYSFFDFSITYADCHPKRPSVPCSAVSV